MSNYRVDDAGRRKAEQMIDAGQYDLDTEWEDANPDADEGNAQIERHGKQQAVQYGQMTLRRWPTRSWSASTPNAPEAVGRPRAVAPRPVAPRLVCAHG